VNIFQLLILVKNSLSVTRRFILNNARSIFRVYIQPYSELIKKKRERNKAHAPVCTASAYIFVAPNSIQVTVSKKISHFITWENSYRYIFCIG
jgi:hypothetical protein